MENLKEDKKMIVILLAAEINMYQHRIHNYPILFQKLSVHINKTTPPPPHKKLSQLNTCAHINYFEIFVNMSEQVKRTAKSQRNVVST